MRHEVDLLSSHRATFKIIETENATLKSKLELLQTVESVLTASQREIDDILRQNMNPKDLAVMVGTLKRELNCNEERKNAMRRQLQMIKNDLRTAQDEKKNLEDMLSCYESKNHALVSRLKKLENDTIKKEEKVINLVDATDNTPEVVKKKPRLALINIDDQNTPSPPLSRDEFQRRIEKIQASDSPYFRVKSSSIGLACAIKNPALGRPLNSVTKSSNDAAKFSILRNPRLNSMEVPASATHKTAQSSSSSMVYNGFGATSKVLQSDLIDASKGLNSFWGVASNSKPIKKKLSATALQK
jgi:hypothetical protein